MPTLLSLDDPVYDLIFSYIRYLDLLNLSRSCKVLRVLVANAQIVSLNCTQLEHVPVMLLPYAQDHYLVDHLEWRILTYKHGKRMTDIFHSNLFWTSKHKLFSPLALRNVVLDGTSINVLDIIYFITACPHLSYLSARFCVNVDRLLLQNFLGTLTAHKQAIALERLDVLGIDGLPFFEPIGNGTTRFNEFEIELTGAGPEFDYQDRWREDMYDFQMTLQRVPTHHGIPIKTDVARCSQAFCRNFPYSAKELADPTIETMLPDCILCSRKWTIPICRICIAARSCKICGTFVCPACKLLVSSSKLLSIDTVGYNNDNDIELYDYSTSQRWMQNITNDLARGGRIVSRNCAQDIKQSCSGSPKGALMMQQTHRHMAIDQVAAKCVEEGFLWSR